MNQNQKSESLKLSAREQGVKFLLGETKVKPSDYPTAEWTRTDGNVFSIIATATNAWKRKDSAVANRMRSLASIAMTGTSEAAPEFAKALNEEADNGADGYYILLGICMAVCPEAEADDCDDEDEEEYWDEEDADEDDE
jgi:hypothetical protein